MNGSGGERVIPEREWGRRRGGVPGCTAPAASAGHLLQVKKNLCPESETRAKGLLFPASSWSFWSPRLIGPQPEIAHPPRLPGAARKPAGALTLSVAAHRLDSGQTSKGSELSPSTWWVSPSLVAGGRGGVSSACLFPSVPLLPRRTRRVPARRRVVSELGEGAWSPR